MPRPSKKDVIEALTAKGVEFDPGAHYNDLCDLLAEQKPIQEVTPPEPVPAKAPKIKVREHLAMCGQATADNHEGRLRDLEEAVEYLLAK